MSGTARQVIDMAVIEWLEAHDYSRFTETQRLENAIGIWEYGKWCAKGARLRLGYQPQIKFRGCRPESTEWDGIRDIGDDEGMMIHAATVGLSAESVEIIERLYVAWQPMEDIPKSMCMRRQTFFALRKEALRDIHRRIKKIA